jgi:thioredoxin 1
MRLVAALLLALHAGAASAAKGGGGVKEIRSKSQFDTLLKYHKISTGLPVVVDYYSDSCGPCRMMEPIYKGMAKEYDGRAVFVKVNVQTTNVGQQIRSMPTFQFWLNGKKMEEFSGGDEGSLRRITADLAKKARQMNMEITAENLFEFYKEHDKSKTVRAAAPSHPRPHPHQRTDCGRPRHAHSWPTARSCCRAASRPTSSRSRSSKNTMPSRR